MYFWYLFNRCKIYNNANQKCKQNYRNICFAFAVYLLGGVWMGMKKLGVSLVLSVVALVTPFTSAFAAAGSWDYLGSKNFYYSSNAAGNITDYVNSGGGNFKVCSNTLVTNLVVLYEYDPGSGNDDKIGYAYLGGGGDCEIFSVGKYVDGDNNKAEIYAWTADSQISSVKFYD
jgi:hypothetical protein